MIVTCPNCRKTLKAPDGAAGKRIRCPGCLEVISVQGEGGGGAGTPVTKPTAKPKPPSASSATSSIPPSGRPASNSSVTASKPVAAPGRRSASTPEGTTGGARSSVPAQPKSKQTTTRSGTTRSGTGGASRPPKRPKPEEPADYDDDYESGYASSGDDPWSSGPSWEEPNPYAAPTYEASSPRSRNKTSGGSLKLAGIGLLVQAWSYIGMIVAGFSLIAIGVIVAATRSGSGGAVGSAEVGIMFAGLGALLLIPMGIAVLVGLVLCVFVPAKTGAQIPMFVTLGLTVLLGAFVILRTFGDLVADVPIVGFALEFIRMLLTLAQEVSFCLFMKAAATFVRRDDLARMANVVMYGFSAVSLLMLIGGVVLGLLAGAVPQVISVVGLLGGGIILLAAIGFWFMQLFLMFRLGTAMKNY